MASIWKNPRLLLVLCMTASITSAEVTFSEEKVPFGRINMRVYSGNRRYPIQSSPVQEPVRETLPATAYRRVDGEAPPAARHSLPDASVNGPRQTYLGGVRRESEVDYRRVTEVPPAAYARPSLPETSHNRPGITHGSRPRSSVNHRRRYPSRISDRDHFSNGGSRYGVRRRNYWKSPSVDEKVNRERGIRVPSPRPLTVHQHEVAISANQDKGRRKKWIHCHQDGIAFVSQDATPQVSGI